MPTNTQDGLALNVLPVAVLIEPLGLAELMDDGFVDLDLFEFADEYVDLNYGE